MCLVSTISSLTRSLSGKHCGPCTTIERLRTKSRATVGSAHSCTTLALGTYLTRYVTTCGLLSIHHFSNVVHGVLRLNVPTTVQQIVTKRRRSRRWKSMWGLERLPRHRQQQNGGHLPRYNTRVSSQRLHQRPPIQPNPKRGTEGRQDLQRRHTLTRKQRR